MIALYALFGIGLFVVVVGSISAYFFFQSETGRQVLQVARDGAAWVAVASQAPGTEELRQAGCEAAMVSNAGSALEVFMTLVPEEQKRDEIRTDLEEQAGNVPLDELLLVVCTLPRFTTSHPECPDLATTYGRAVPTAPDSFYVLVMQQGQQEPSCQGLYDPDGTPLQVP
jgi:hypothetical protein